MNILLVVSSYLPNVGGLQSVTSSLARELDRRGHRVSVLTHRYPRTLSASEKIEGIPVSRWFFLIPRLTHLKNKRLDLFLAALIYFPLTLARLVWRIARDKPDAINLHFVGAPAPFLLLARWLVRFRLIVSLHGDDVEGFARGTRFDRWVWRAILCRADAVTACSRYLLERAQSIKPSIAPIAHAIHNGIEVTQGTFEPSADFILAVGRFVPNKGFDVLLDALVHSVNVLPRLKLIGDGPARGTLESLARELGLNECVEFLGAQARTDAFRVMRASRLVVIPSRADSFGLVALEAMVAGKPVVATRVGGLPEVLEGADAILVEPENPRALADAIRDALMRLEREPSFGARNRACAARFSIAQMTDAYVTLYVKP